MAETERRNRLLELEGECTMFRCIVVGFSAEGMLPATVECWLGSDGWVGGVKDDCW